MASESNVPCLPQRYADRVLMVSTNVSTIYCRILNRETATRDCGDWEGSSHDE